ncbi:MAG: type II secretion system F family protein [Gammaproteobacteria bacterium]|nr:MAG: type II secretion system F family protein [Gammaproteobacteria bacterium]
MPEFHYQAVSAQGREQRGVIEAASVPEAVRRLSAQGLTPLRLDAREVRRRTPLPGRRRRVPRDLLLQALAELLGAGIELGTALAILARTSEEPGLAPLAERLLEDLREGRSFSQALAGQGFAPDQVNLVANAEQAGRLAGALHDLAAHLERTRALRESLVSALLYPAILAIVALASILVILLFVVPRFEVLFEEAQGRLPAMTALVLALGHLLRRFGGGLVLLLALLGIAGWGWFGLPSSRRRLDRWVLRLPWLGEHVRSVEGARFFYSLGMLLENGIAAGEALPAAVQAVRNGVLRERLAAVEQQVREGGSLAAALLALEVFPARALQMLQVGEETGRLGPLATRAARHLAARTELRVRRLVTVLEPAMILALGLVIGTLVIALFLGIVSVNDLPLE